MDKCEFYGGTEFVTPTETKIKCKLMPGGGKVFENSSKEGKETSLRCWHGGTDCPLLSDNSSADIDNEQLNDDELLDTDFTQRAKMCPHYTDNTSNEEETDVQQIEMLSTSAISTERQEKAIKLHKQVIANGKIAADCMVAMGRDLKIIRDEKLFSEFDCENFEEYCEKKVGIGKRHGYNFIQVYERFGEQRLTELQGLGITKLLEIAQLDDEDMADLMQNSNVSEMSVRQLHTEIEKYKKECEQLTLELEDERDKARTLNDNSKVAALEAQLEEMKGLLAAANNEKDNAEERYSKQKAALIEEHEKEKQHLNDDYLAEHKTQEDRHKEAIKALKDKADDERVTAVNAARKQEAAKYAAEIEKLKAENAALQSNAKTSTPPDDSRESIKFYLGECQRAFNSALDTINSVEDEYSRSNFKDGMKKVVEQMANAI